MSLSHDTRLVNHYRYFVFSKRKVSWVCVICNSLVIKLGSLCNKTYIWIFSRIWQQRSKVKVNKIPRLAWGRMMIIEIYTVTACNIITIKVYKSIKSYIFFLHYNNVSPW